MNVKRENGTLKKGRPINSNSKRQIRLNELDLKRKNGTLSKGRNIDPNSKRQIRLAEVEAKKSLNIEIDEVINEVVAELIK